MKKRGTMDIWSALIGIVLLLFVFFMIYFIIISGGEKIGGVKYEQSCQLSVLARDNLITKARSVIPSETLKKYMAPEGHVLEKQSLECTPWFITYQHGSKNAIKKGGSSNVQIRTVVDQESLNRELADHIARCYWKMGEGKKQFTETWLPSDTTLKLLAEAAISPTLGPALGVAGSLIKDSKIVCIPCAEIDFEITDEGFDDVGFDLRSYTQNTKFRPPQRKTKMTYDDYLNLEQMFIYSQAPSYIFSRDEKNTLMYFVVWPISVNTAIVQKEISNRLHGEERIFSFAYNYNKNKGFFYGVMIGESATIYNFCDEYMVR